MLSQVKQFVVPIVAKNGVMQAGKGLQPFVQIFHKTGLTDR